MPDDDVQDIIDIISGRLVIDKYGSRYYYNEEGRPHRTDGPAIEYSNGTKVWYINGLRHRTDGPAIEWADGDKEWCLNGVRLSKKEFDIRAKYAKG